MLTNTSDLFRLGAGFLVIAGALVYALATISGSTKPFKATWIVWLVLSYILMESLVRDAPSAASYKAKADFWGYVIVVLGFIISSMLSGKLLDLSRWDFVCLLFAALSYYLLNNSSNPDDAFYTALVTDFLVWLPIFIKALFKPNEDNWLTWLFFVANSILCLIAVYTSVNQSTETQVFAWYFLASNLLMLLASLRRAPKVSLEASVAQEGLRKSTPQVE